MCSLQLEYPIFQHNIFRARLHKTETDSELCLCSVWEAEALKSVTAFCYLGNPAVEGLGTRGPAPLLLSPGGDLQLRGHGGNGSGLISCASLCTLNCFRLFMHTSLLSMSTWGVPSPCGRRWRPSTIMLVMLGGLVSPHPVSSRDVVRPEGCGAQVTSGELRPTASSCWSWGLSCSPEISYHPLVLRADQNHVTTKRKAFTLGNKNEPLGNTHCVHTTVCPGWRIPSSVRL